MNVILSFYFSKGIGYLGLSKDQIEVQIGQKVVFFNNFSKLEQKYLMNKTLMPFVFKENMEAINYKNEYILIESSNVAHLDYPVKLSFTIVVVCLKGRIKGKSNMRYFETEAPCLLVLMAKHTIIIEDISNDFSALFIVMSNTFTASLNIEEQLPVFISLHDKPFISLHQKELESLEDYFKTVKKVLKETDNPYTIKIIQHFTKAYFYGFGYYVHHIAEQNKNGKKPRQEELVEKFLNDVQSYFYTEREIKFYADRLYVTPKYLSKVIKEHNGLSAKQWIDDYVICEAKSLLKSTNMTVQQISDELNFPSQSFFGKYFKRAVGLSPLEYRKE